jgi:X-X-X-Leu-X-X-Gly heptad repeat protein
MTIASQVMNDGIARLMSGSGRLFYGASQQTQGLRQA